MVWPVTGGNYARSFTNIIFIPLKGIALLWIFTKVSDMKSKSSAETIEVLSKIKVSIFFK